MPGRLHILTDADIAEVRRVRGKVDGIDGPGVLNAPDSVSLRPIGVIEETIPDEPGLATQTRYRARVTGYVQAQAAFTGELLEAPFYQFVETPDVGIPTQKPLLQTNGAGGIELIDGSITPDLFANALSYTDSMGDEVWYFEFFRSIPAGGQPGEALHVGLDGNVFWSVPFMVGPPA